MKLKTTILAILIGSACWAQKLVPTNTTALLKGKVVDIDGKIAPGQLVTFTNPKTKEEYNGVSNDTGYFEMLIPQGVTYEMVVSGFSGAENINQIEMPSPGGPYSFDLTVTTESTNTSIMTLDVTYKTNSAELEPGSFSAIDDLYEWMAPKKDIKIEISGHTDSDGSDSNNMALSQKRAESVKTYLLKKGIDTKRIIAKGLGESKPIATNETAEGKAKNRRTEVRIIAH